MHHLGQRAVHPGDHGVGDPVGHLEHRHLRRQVEVIGVGAPEVGEHRRLPSHRPHRLPARLGHPPQARPAPLARSEVLVGDPVALGQRLTGPIGGHAVAQGVHDARHLVPDDAAVVPGHRPQPPVTSPDVEIGPADVGPGDPHHRRPWCRVGDRQVGELHGFAGTEEQRRPTGCRHVRQRYRSRSSKTSAPWWMTSRLMWAISAA